MTNKRKKFYFSKKKFTPVTSLKAREIFYVELESYEITCSICHKITQYKIQCQNCNKPFFQTHKLRGRRPHIILYAPDVSSQDLGESLVICIPITSKSIPEPGNVILPADNKTNLKRPSTARIFFINVIDKNLFFQENRIGEMGDKEWEEIKQIIANDILSIKQDIIEINGEEYSQKEIKFMIEKVNKLQLVVEGGLELKEKNSTLILKLKKLEKKYVSLEFKLKNKNTKIDKKDKKIDE